MIRNPTPTPVNLPLGLIHCPRRSSPSKTKLLRYSREKSLGSSKSLDSLQAWRDSLSIPRWWQWKRGWLRRLRHCSREIWPSTTSSRRSGNHGLWGQNGAANIMRTPGDDRSFFRTSGIIDQGGKAYTRYPSQFWRSTSVLIVDGSRKEETGNPPGHCSCPEWTDGSGLIRLSPPRGGSSAQWNWGLEIECSPVCKDWPRRSSCLKRPLQWSWLPEDGSAIDRTPPQEAPLHWGQVFPPETKGQKWLRPGGEHPTPHPKHLTRRRDEGWLGPDRCLPPQRDRLSGAKQKCFCD